ncbi:ankyrin repeat domain-containing protein 27-like [Centruroides sculpturatus]|nr:ankyrin repeat domain-containing protein 27-like [Centruroides sculpturatus]
MLLIHFNADVNARDNKGNTALHVATFNGRSDMIELLLQCGAEVDTFNHDRNTPVHIACQNCIPGTKFILLKLLRAQPDLLAKNKDGATPFDLSAQYGRIDAVALLLDHEPAFRTSSRAFIDSCIRGHKDVVRLMLDYGIDPDIEDPYHNSCGLHEACRFLR